MTGLNRVVLMGNLTRDPQIRQIPSGTSVADLGLAASEAYKNRDGKNVETTCFVDIVTWGRQAETCAEYLSKGSRVLIEGRLQLDQWESQNGEKRSKMRVRASRVQFLGSPKGSSSAKKDSVQVGIPVAGGSSAETDDVPF
ncbi:single-stranded DNA-binding protein [Verrucomicrobiota bacterium]